MSKVKKNAPRGKAILGKIKVDEKETIYVGVDVHKKQYHVAVWSRMREALIASWVGAPSAQALIGDLEPVRDHVAGVVYEAGPTGFALARRLKEDGWPIEVISAAHTPEAPVDDDKCDRLDAKKLAQYSAKGLLRAVYVPTEEEEAE